MKQHIMKALLVISLVFFGAGYAQATTNKNYDSKNFINILSQKYEKKDGVSPAEQRGDAVRAYIDKCCQQKDVALALLKDSDFRINQISNQDEIRRLNDYYKRSFENHFKNSSELKYSGFDSITFAKKRSWRWENYILVPTEYRITLFSNEGKIFWTTTNLEFSMPIWESKNGND